MREPRPHDLLQVDGLDNYLPIDAPTWVKPVLRGTSWVVIHRTGTSSQGHAVGVRGARRTQRYELIAPQHCVVDRVVPEDVAGVRSWPIRDAAALQALREVRAPLNRLGFPWGPIGSVGFELATGLAAVMPEDDLDLIVRVPDRNRVFDQLLWLHDNHFRKMLAPVDCQIETPVGTIGLRELVSRACVVSGPSVAGSGSRPGSGD
jgi:phosphoribosyl-dephospho-CoA transferase